MNIRLLISSVLFCCLLSSIWSQKQIVCQSGQIITLDGANNFLFTNADSIASNYKSNNDNEKNLYSLLLNSELQNKLRVAAISKEIAINQYDMGRAAKSEKNTYAAKLKSLEKELKVLNENYKLTSQEIKKMVKHDKKAIDQLLVKYKNAIAPTDINNQSRESTTPVNQKDDYADDKIDAIQETVTVPANESDSKKKESNKLEHSKIEKSNNGCNISFVGRNIENKKQTILHFERLLTYTPDKVKSYYKLNNFLIINAALEKLDGKIYLNVEARFDSKDALKSYGKIHKSDFLRIEFVSGKKLFLTSTTIEEPYIEKHSANSVYKVKYLFDSSSDLGLLEREYIDKFGIMWSSGFESYPVYDVDFLQRQMKCLKNAK